MWLPKTKRLDIIGSEKQISQIIKYIERKFKAEKIKGWFHPR